MRVACFVGLGVLACRSKVAVDAVEKVNMGSNFWYSVLVHIETYAHVWPALLTEYMQEDIGKAMVNGN